MADAVEKVFWGIYENFLKLLMRSMRGDVWATSRLRKTTTDFRIGTTKHRSGGVVQKSPLRDFWRGSIFDFFDTIGPFETCRLRRAMSEFEGKAENICSH
jgi:hypothetical protein